MAVGMARWMATVVAERTFARTTSMTSATHIAVPPRESKRASDRVGHTLRDRGMQKVVVPPGGEPAASRRTNAGRMALRAPSSRTLLERGGAPVPVGVWDAVVQSCLWEAAR